MRLHARNVGQGNDFVIVFMRSISCLKFNEVGLTAIKDLKHGTCSPIKENHLIKFL